MKLLSRTWRSRNTSGRRTELTDTEWQRYLEDEPSRERPMRMCLGCRERHPQGELVRLQLTPDGVKIIERWEKSGPGRSIYFCPNVTCFEKALKRGALPFKRSKRGMLSVRLEPRQAERLRYAFTHAARRLRGDIGSGPQV